ncbi:hypothetical protein G6O67_001096 [Ophiocordyceps sinensis]|uniref:Uncharacterized protein n=1 Tax=Ophiocordyceps sinensis TaxID=72228 RepID=A0A8H4V8V7_9HYPO|nr:hypothetical protein G6O67_001096 [Ophiocordyceps sinensis]
MTSLQDAPNPIPNSFQLVVPKKPQLNIHNDPAKNLIGDGKSLTAILVMIYNVSLSAFEDLEAFQESECYRHLDTADLPYDPVAFYHLAQRYIDVICRESLVWIKAEIKARPQLKTHLKPPFDDTTFEALFKTVETEVFDALWQVEEVGRSLEAFYGKAALDLEPIDQVPNVSLREVRLWCQLNTSHFIAKLDQAHSLEALESIMNEQVLDVIRAQDSNVTDYKLTGNQKHNNQAPSPWVYLICTGIGKHGERIHKHVHIGATKERLDLWPELNVQREAARENLIGEAARRAWAAWFRMLVNLEENKTDDEARQVRKDLMLGKVPTLEPKQAESARSVLARPLRDCRGHLGQAFSLTGWNAAKVIGSCYICKMTTGFAEVHILADGERNAGAGQDSVKDKDAEVAKGISLTARQRTAYSCAEIPASRRCVAEQARDRVGGVVGVGAGRGSA